MSATDYDVVIAGAGMVGATVGAALAKSDLRVCILDRREPPAFPGKDHELRVSAVNVAAETMFQKLGAWQAMADLRVSPMRRMHVWDEQGRGATTFDSADIAEPHLGHIIENNVVTRALIDVIENAGTVDTRWDHSVARIDHEPDRVTINFDERASVSTRLLIGTDGARSRVRELAQIQAQTFDYDQRTVVAIARTERPHENTAWQRFLPSGPLAFLPLTDGLSSIAWHADTQFAQSLIEMNADELGQAISEHSQGRLGQVSVLTPQGSFKLIRMHANTYHNDRVVLAGDAAHAIHPLAGLGANLGFMDAASLVDLLMEKPGRDPADPRTLRRYERWRRGPNSAVVGVTDAFKKTFGTSAPVIERARNVGLTLANVAGPAKTTVIRQAMGLTGDLPQITRRG